MSVHFQSHLHEENTVGKPAQRLNLAEPVWEALASRPLTQDCSQQSHKQRHTVEEHMNTIAKKTQGVCNVTVESLNSHERKVKPENGL